VSRHLDRRPFWSAGALTLLGGAAITVGGCIWSPADPDPVPAAVDRSGAIAANHGHEVVLTHVQQTAGAGVVLPFTGTASHVHGVELSADDVVSIRRGMRVSRGSSSTAAHVHAVTFN
jgi:hypothetical protein